MAATALVRLASARTARQPEPTRINLQEARHYDTRLTRLAAEWSLMALTWFRFYSEFVHDPKVRTMPEVMRYRLVALFCLHCEGSLKDLDDEMLACTLGITLAELEETRALFQKRGFIGRTWIPKNWDKRQYKSDTSAERVRRHRSKQADAGNVAETPPKRPGNGDVTLQERYGNATVTAPHAGAPAGGRARPGAGADSDSDTDSDTEQRPPKSPREPNPERAGAAASERDSLDSWARSALGDRHDLENLGPNLGAWLPVYGREWCELAVMEGLAHAPHGKLVVYAHSCLKRAKSEGRFISTTEKRSPAQTKMDALREGFAQKAREAERGKG